MLVLSQYAEPGYAIELLEDCADGIGYLLKDRINDLPELTAAVRRVAAGGSALDSWSSLSWSAAGAETIRSPR